MLYRQMPKNGDRLSILGFGCMRLPMKDHQIDEPRAIAQIRHAIDRGVNYVDTAWPYHAGQSEIILGKALKDGYRQKVKLATKLPSWMIQNRQDMDRYLKAQLEKLGADRIDYYLIHSLDGVMWRRMVSLGVVDFIQQATRDGRVGNAGFSYHGLTEDFRAVVDGYPWVFCQIQYNYLDEDYQAGTAGLEYAASKGLGVIVMEPLRGGNLAAPTPPTAVAPLWNQAKTRRTPVEWALRWVWNRPEVTVVLSGMNDESHIEQNLAIADTALPGSLSKEELDLVKQAATAYRTSMKVGCTGCGYCMPCPSGVNIPVCFEEYNKMHLFGPVQEGRFRYALRMSGELTDGTPAFASQCVQCGACLEKCPQHIAIPEQIAQVSAEMDGPDLDDRLALARKFFKIEAK